MSLKYILTQVCNKMGLDPSYTEQRNVALRFINEAADEIYAQADIAGTLMEQVFQVNGDQTVSLPYYVGELRAMREYNSQIAWHINQMRPRYNMSNWRDMWRNWRIKNHQALSRAITNEAQLTITVPAVESPAVVVTITGSTDDAASITETITLSSVSATTVNRFNDVTALTKDRVNNGDVTVSDVDGNILSVIPNNQLEALYMIVDVSQLPWSNEATAAADHWIEVLYKKALPWLQNDGDEFPAKGYDNAIVNKCLQLWAEEQEKGDLAMLYDSKATRTLARKHDNENKATEEAVSFVTNGHDELVARIRNNRPGRQAASIYPYGVS